MVIESFMEFKAKTSFKSYFGLRIIKKKVKHIEANTIEFIATRIIIDVSIILLQCFLKYFILLVFFKVVYFLYYLLMVRQPRLYQKDYIPYSFLILLILF